MRTRKASKKLIRAYTLSPATLENIDSLARITGLDNSQIVDGCIQATWASIVSMGFRQEPSIVEALEVTGAVGAGYYIRGQREGEREA